MKASKFLQNKLNRQLSCNGVLYLFELSTKDKFHQSIPSGETVSILGIYHERNSYISEQDSEGTRTTSKKIPMILCRWSDAKKCVKDSIVKIQDETYRVIDITNIQNYSIVGDISLEVVQ